MLSMSDLDLNKKSVYVKLQFSGDVNDYILTARVTMVECAILSQTKSISNLASLQFLINNMIQFNKIMFDFLAPKVHNSNTSLLSSSSSSFELKFKKKRKVQISKIFHIVKKNH